ncbi:MAG: UvrD-helicase domain-containing protein [Hyphomonadaceae bacterium]|nr:UvrD-helicase domain-containing protein [Hyphomonadaceae bacterium]
MTASPFTPPEITDEDVAWAAKTLGLPADAFSGPDGTDPRLHILKSVETLDVEACPGSGKTTLLVAKLAILARKWTDARRGVCILSHTNVARREIETSLGFTPEGRRLLCYPHYVGTIHGFVNEFLAVPWLRSLGYPASTIDDQQCEAHRRRLLQLNQFITLRNYVGARENNPQTNLVAAWHVNSPTFDVIKDSGQPEIANANAPSAQQLRALAKKCAEDGFHRYREVFMWANDLLDKHPLIAATIKQRFPMLFIDEVQDNNEFQSALIHRLFIEGDRVAVRQRYGDSNQAIYGHANDKGAESDVFPQDEIRKDVPNSHRFGQQIADIANPLGLVPHGLQGRGPSSAKIASDTSNKHAIFLFTDQTVTRVLEAYAAHLSETFTEQELRDGVFTAVGAVHRPGAEDNVPRFVRHYWPEYDHELTSSEPKPATFFQYVTAGRKTTFESGEAHQAVEKIAEGTIRLARLVNPAARLAARRRRHSQILEALVPQPEVREHYRALVSLLVHPKTDLAANKWDNEWCGKVIAIAGSLAGTAFTRSQQAEFLTWPVAAQAGQQAQKPRRDNFYRYPAASPTVAIRVGSIHSVKGETHTATMLLDTFFHEHHLQELKPWLIGANAGRGNSGVRMQARLKQHYVGMTRPSHLLCLAMRDTFTPQEIETLKARAWRVGRIEQAAVNWL